MGPMAWMALASLAQTMNQADEAKRQAKLQAATARYSPWTGMRPDMGAIQRPTGMGNIIQGVLTGASMEQSSAAAKQQQEIANLYRLLLAKQLGVDPTSQAGQQMYTPSETPGGLLGRV